MSMSSVYDFGGNNLPQLPSRAWWRSTLTSYRLTGSFARIFSFLVNSSTNKNKDVSNEPLSNSMFHSSNTDMTFHLQPVPVLTMNIVPNHLCGKW